MEKIKSLRDVLEQELRDLYSAEMQIVKALPKMAEAAASAELEQALNEHLKETKNQVTRLEKSAELLEFKIGGKTCQAMKGLLEEGEEVVNESGKESPFTDARIIGAAQRVEHYEMAGYGTARSLAEALGLDEVANLLQETLDEESAADEKLTAISEEEVIPACFDTEGESGESARS